MSIRAFLKSCSVCVEISEKTSVEVEATKKFLENESCPVLIHNPVDATGRRLIGRLVGNLWADRVRIASALNTSPDLLVVKLKEAMEEAKPGADIEILSSAPFMENIIPAPDIDLTLLPIPKYYPYDAGRYITSGVIIAKHPDRDTQNMSFHRMLIKDRNKLAVRIVPRHLHALYMKSLAENKDLPVAVAIGLCPSVLLPAAMSVDFHTDELDIAGALRRICLSEKLFLTPLSNGIRVPSYAEYIFEGSLTQEKAEEGPFVDITGTYDEVRQQPVLVVDRIYHRTDPVMTALVPGKREHFLMMGMPREPVILSAVRKVVPDVRGVRLTEGGCCWLHGIISIKKTREGDGKNAGLAALSAHPSMKMVIVVDEDIDIYDDKMVEWAVATRFQAGKGLDIIRYAAGSTLDKSAYPDGTTDKVIIDATYPPWKKEMFMPAKIDACKQK